jgi:hypothetical protein
MRRVRIEIQRERTEMAKDESAALAKEIAQMIVGLLQEPDGACGEAAEGNTFDAHGLKREDAAGGDMQT